MLLRLAQPILRDAQEPPDRPEAPPDELLGDDLPFANFLVDLAADRGPGISHIGGARAGKTGEDPAGHWEDPTLSDSASQNTLLSI